MFDNEDDGPPPRHRKDGRARKRGTTTPGRHLSAVDDLKPDPGPPGEGCECPPEYHHFGTHAPGVRVRRSDFPVPPGAYPVEDLAGMSLGAAAMLLRRAEVDAGSEAAHWPHVLITRDTATGVVTCSEPYPSGVEALQRAQDFVGKYRGLEPRWDYTLTVAPLLGH